MLIPLTLNLDITCDPLDGCLVIKTKDQTYSIDSSSKLTFSVSVIYTGQDSIDLFQVSGFHPGQKQMIQIHEIKNNDLSLYYWNRLLTFNNHQCIPLEVNATERIAICSDGVLCISPAVNRSAFEWFPYHYSKARSGYVYENSSIDCPNHHGYRCALPWCDSSTPRQTWPNQSPMDLCDSKLEYDTICFGCSQTFGSALRHGEEWPALLAQDQDSVLNISVPGIGAEGIYLNLLHSLGDFNTKRVIIVYPNRERRLMRWRQGDQHIRIPVSSINVKNFEHYRKHLNGLFVPQDMQWLSRRTFQLHRDSVLGRAARLNNRVMLRIRDLLREREIPALYSSWDPDTYNELKSITPADQLLPQFPWDKGAPDGWHSSAAAHREWYQSWQHRTK